MAKVFTITEGLENMGALKTGGQGSVYKGRRIGEIITAVKLLPTPIHSESPEDRHFQAFQNEVSKLKRVNAKPNPHVVKILSSGITETGSLPFIEMEYVEGPDLEDLLKPPHDPIFSIKEAIRVADQLSNALSHCHQVSVKHGDVKTNNVKFNIATGNYILLDFGMSMMSDEQRRTSMRHAGAIEFMAPEQSEGKIMFQTDVYSFGIVLYELLAGSVPFPLSDGSETARNKVMLAHMDTPPPDLLGLRRNALPDTWTEERKEVEMQVPEWLVNTIYICLQKKPESRFADGRVLHEYIVLRNTKTVMPVTDNGMLLQLQQEKQRLLQDNEQLRRQVAELQQRGGREAYADTQPLSTTELYQPQKNNSSLFYILLIVAVLAGAFFIWYKWGRKSGGEQAVSPRTESAQKATQYKVLAARAYFYDEPNAASRRDAYMVPSADIITATNERNGFVYVEFRNSRGQLSKGWLRKADLVPVDQWDPGATTANADPTPAEINTRLGEARRLLDRNRIPEALVIYNDLAARGVPEALYEAGNLGLQKRNGSVECGGAYNMVQAAADKGYAPAKRTLGFLYYFADNPDILDINNYQHCTYERNVFKGTKLLMEAVLAGDSTAKRLVEELNIGRMPADTDTTSRQ
ncbi:MAG: protein kinase [Flaviaesturariibacter sp.]|nr:protein kinase [Flaviaesturariibacter sp.]